MRGRSFRCFGPSSCSAGRSDALGPCVGQLASAPSAHPPEVSGVGPQSANLGVRNRASGERQGCLSLVNSPGAKGGGRQRPRQLWRVLEYLYFLFLFEKFFLFKPSWSKQAPGCSQSSAWLCPKNPAADPAPGLGLQPPWSLLWSQGPYCP